MHLIREKRWSLQSFKEHIIVTSFYIVVAECPWCPHIYKTGGHRKCITVFWHICVDMEGILYSRKEESSVQQLYSITLLVHKCCPLQVRGGGGAWLDVGGKVECVALEFSDGDGRMLEVIQQHLDLGHDVM